MAGFLLDTNILSDLLRNPRGRVAARIQEVGAATVCTSIIVAAELRCGVEKGGSSRLPNLVEGLLLRVPVLPLDSPAEHIYGRLRARLEKTGRTVGALDLLIAAHAISLGRTLITDNVREFAQIEELKAANWIR
jgi:tRNA(fMet)-specific endonuclease VapC